MTTQSDVDKLFLETLEKSDIKHVSVDGFDKYIVYNGMGTLFVIGFNPTTNKHGFGRTQVMLQNYKNRGIPINMVPDYKSLYNQIVRIYKIYRTVMDGFQPVFSMMDDFTNKMR